MKTLIIGNFKLKALFFAVIFLLLVATLAGSAAELKPVTTTPWLAFGLRSLSWVSSLLLFLLVLWSVWTLAVKLGLPSLFTTQQIDTTPPEKEIKEIDKNIKNLSQVLANVEADSSKASLLLLDAQTYTQNLVDLIQAIALKAEAMQQEADILQSALASIATQEPLKIAQAAGEVKDQHIRTLMLTKVRDAGYWQDTSILIATQVGTLTQWQQGYRTFASNLLSEVSKAKAQLSAQTAALELVGTSRPLLQAQANLGEAQHYLQLQRNPGLHEAAKQLPAINVGLLE